MNQELSSAIQTYLDSSDDILILDNVRVGRVKFGKMIVRGRDAAFNALDLLQATMDKTRRIRVGSAASTLPAPLSAGPGRKLSVAIKDHLTHQGRRRLRQATIDDTMRTLRVLLVACGDIPITRITTDHVFTAWDLLTWLPPGDVWKSHLNNVHSAVILAKGIARGTRPAAANTMEKHRRFLVTFFRKLESTGAIRISPMAGFGKVSTDLTRSSGRAVRFFSNDELQRIFDPMTFIQWAKKFPHRWWCPILSLFTGARINELAQLKLGDVFEDGGNWWISFQITGDDGLPTQSHVQSHQSLKGASAVRTIPVHPALLEAGFSDFVADMRACGHGRLFPHLSAGTYKGTQETKARYSEAVGGQFSVYLKELGFELGVGFHAFRHVFITHLAKKHVHDADIAMLTGHSAGRDFPVLQRYKNPDELKNDQVKRQAMLQFQPDVKVPTYRRGQFKAALSDPSKFHP